MAYTEFPSGSWCLSARNVVKRHQREVEAFEECRVGDGVRHALAARGLATGKAIYSIIGGATVGAGCLAVGVTLVGVCAPLCAYGGLSYVLGGCESDARSELTGAFGVGAAAGLTLVAGGATCFAGLIPSAGELAISPVAPELLKPLGFHRYWLRCVKSSQKNNNPSRFYM